MAVDMMTWVAVAWTATEPCSSMQGGNQLSGDCPGMWNRMSLVFEMLQQIAVVLSPC